ncbi:hypothetical protein ACFYN3_24990 [Streptomyces lavendulae]|uniref:hypothetical protein n=1 Tax=Streptomyces lavendulae TaxID=1914 RepID=UPI00368B907B
MPDVLLVHPANEQDAYIQGARPYTEGSGYRIELSRRRGDPVTLVQIAMSPEAADRVGN